MRNYRGIMSVETEIEASTDYLAIDAQDVQLTYGDGTKAVKNISLQVPAGEFFGFLGPNGAGKTTFIKILTTLLNPTKGSVKVNGFELGSESQGIRETIGYMDQETSVDEELTARENIRFACEAYGVPQGEREARIEKLLELVDLTDAGDKKAGDFSGGMKKRLDTATALVHKPPLLFLDEPTTGLDPKSRKKLWKYFERINSEGRTIFLTTQYLEEADQLCDNIAVIQNGEIIAEDSPSGLKKRSGGSILEIELKEDAEIKDQVLEIVRSADIFDDKVQVEPTRKGVNVISNQVRKRGTDVLVKLRDRGIPISGFNLHEPTLDQVFLSITGEHLDDKDSEVKKDRSRRER